VTALPVVAAPAIASTAIARAWVFFIDDSRMDVGMAGTGRRAAIDAPVQLYEIPNSASAAGARG
jgi:hypothetical protein